MTGGGQRPLRSPTQSGARRVNAAQPAAGANKAVDVPGRRSGGNQLHN